MQFDIAHFARFLGEHQLWAAPLLGAIAFGESIPIVGTVLPATVFMVIAGGLSTAGVLDPALMVVSAFIGAVAGDLVVYLLAHRWGRSALRWPVLAPHRRLIARARYATSHYGMATMVLGRFSGPLKPLLPILAGSLHMSAFPFHLSNVAGSAIWVGAFVGGGMLGAEGARHLGAAAPWALVALMLAGAAVLIAKFAKRGAAHSDPTPAHGRRLLAVTGRGLDCCHA